MWEVGRRNESVGREQKEGKRKGRERRKKKKNRLISESVGLIRKATLK